MKLRNVPHAEMQLVWLQDPSLEVEEFSLGFDSWYKCIPTWDAAKTYRFKPKTIKIGEFEINEPYCVAPKVKTLYYVPYLVGIGSSNAVERWFDAAYDKNLLAKGLCFKTKEDAELCAKAMLSLLAEKKP
jgi:hypothetical protein